jgi:hypothetical protein
MESTKKQTKFKFQNSNSKQYRFVMRPIFRIGNQKSLVKKDWVFDLYRKDAEERKEKPGIS